MFEEAIKTIKLSTINYNKMKNHKSCATSTLEDQISNVYPIRKYLIKLRKGNCSIGNYWIGFDVNNGKLVKISNCFKSIINVTVLSMKIKVHTFF